MIARFLFRTVTAAAFIGGAVLFSVVIITVRSSVFLPIADALRRCIS